VQFKDAHDMTIGIEFGSREVALKDSIIKLEIWDTVCHNTHTSLQLHTTTIACDGCSYMLQKCRLYCIAYSAQSAVS
jgi:Ras family